MRTTITVDDGLWERAREHGHSREFRIGPQGVGGHGGAGSDATLACARRHDDRRLGTRAKSKRRLDARHLILVDTSVWIDHFNQANSDMQRAFDEGIVTRKSCKWWKVTSCMRRACSMSTFISSRPFA